MKTDMPAGEAARIAREGAMIEALLAAREMRAAQDRHFLYKTFDSRQSVRALEMRFDRLLAAVPFFPAEAPVFAAEVQS